MPKIYVLHVHPDSRVPVKRRTYSFTCDGGNCTAVGAQRLSIGFGGAWRVLGRPDAWPVLFDGDEIGNPYDTKLTIPVDNACGESFQSTYIIQYDYINSQYTMSCNIYKEFNNGSTYPLLPSECYAVFPHIIGYNGDKPIWRTELDVNERGYYYGASRTVNYRGSAGPAGIAVDYRRLRGWYPELRISTFTTSKIMIGRQRNHGNIVMQTRHYTEYEDGQPVQKPYLISGPSITYSEIVSNIKVDLVAKQPNPTPPGPKKYGTVVVTTWHNEGYVVGAQIFSMNNANKNTISGMIGSSRCSFVSEITTHPLAAIIKKDGLLLCGSTNVTVEPFKSVEAKIDLEDLYQYDNEIYAVTPVQYRDESGNIVEGYGSLDIDIDVSYLTLTSMAGGQALITKVAGNTVVKARGCVRMYLDVAETTLGGGFGKTYKVPKALQYTFHTGFGGKMVILPWVIERVKTTKGWLSLARYNEELRLARIAKNDALLFGTPQIIKMGTPILAGQGFNVVLAEFMLNTLEDLPETPPDYPEEPNEPDEPNEPSNPDDPDDPYDPYDPYDGPNDGPFEPIERCIKIINPFTGDSDDPVLPDPVIVDPPYDPDDPDPPVEKTFSYILESQAMVLGNDTPKVCRLYSFEGVISGKNGEMVEVGYYKKMHKVDGVSYYAQSPLGILCLDSGGSAVASGAKLSDVVKITFGVAPTGSKFILMGEFDQDSPPTTGKLHIRIDPALKANIEVKSGEEIVVTGIGPVIDTDIIPGNYVVTVTYPGYTSANIVVTVVGGESTDITIPIKPITITKKFISFNVTSTYPGSAVYINGRKMKITTPFGYGVQISGYTVFTFAVEKIVNGNLMTGYACVAVDELSDSLQIVRIQQYCVAIS